MERHVKSRSVRWWNPLRTIGKMPGTHWENAFHNLSLVRVEAPSPSYFFPFGGRILVSAYFHTHTHTFVYVWETVAGSDYIRSDVIQYCCRSVVCQVVLPAVGSGLGSLCHRFSEPSSSLNGRTDFGVDCAFSHTLLILVTVNIILRL